MPSGAHPSVVQELLEQVRGDFYHDLPPQHFFRDRRMLLYALSWPATWLQQRALTMHPPRYRKLILLCLNQIKTHADRDKLDAYFPAYLLKSLQQYLFHHGDSLYEELKHVRNALEPLMQKFPQSNPEDSTRLVSTLAHLNRLLYAHKKPRKTSSAQQLTFSF